MPQFFKANKEHPLFIVPEVRTNRNKEITSTARTLSLSMDNRGLAQNTKSVSRTREIFPGKPWPSFKARENEIIPERSRAVSQGKVAANSNSDNTRNNVAPTHFKVDLAVSSSSIVIVSAFRPDHLRMSALRKSRRVRRSLQVLFHPSSRRTFGWKKTRK